VRGINGPDLIHATPSLGVSGFDMATPPQRDEGQIVEDIVAALNSSPLPHETDWDHTGYRTQRRHRSTLDSSSITSSSPDSPRYQGLGSRPTIRNAASGNLSFPNHSVLAAGRPGSPRRSEESRARNSASGPSSPPEPSYMHQSVFGGESHLRRGYAVGSQPTASTPSLPESVRCP